MTRKRERQIAVGLALGCALLALCIGTTSSPLYATNFWTDTNIYFTIGRGMTRGLMPYRDLFDHKGPLLYMLYAVGAWLCDTGFAGVFALEVLSLALALLLGYGVVRLYGDCPLSWAAMPIQAVATVCCRAFTQGGSAEEFCLPALVLALYCALRVLREGDACAHPLRLCAALGAGAGWVAMIKYTDCGLFAGLGLAVLVYVGRLRGWRSALNALAAMIGGGLAVVLPVAGVMAACGALGDCVEVYILQNLFSYSGAPMTLTGHLYNALAYLRTQSVVNPLVAALAVLGMVHTAWAALRQRGRGLCAHLLAVPLGAGLLLLTVYWGEMAHPYYALVFAALMPAGLAVLAYPKLRSGSAQSAILAGVAGLVIAIVPVCYACCAATPLLTVRAEDMPQTRFAAVMRAEDAPTLLDLTSLDQGFYLAADITPSCRYFVDNNLQTQEKKQALAQTVAQRDVQFIVTRGGAPGEGYALVDEAEGLFDLADRRRYFLYQRADDEP